MLPAPTCACQQSFKSLLHITLLNMPVSLQLARTHSPLLQGEQSLKQGLYEAQVSGSSFQEQHQMYMQFLSCAAVRIDIASCLP